MDQKPPAKNAPRKLRFAPKPPKKEPTNIIQPKVEKTEIDAEEAMSEQLLLKLNDSMVKKGRPKLEQKSEEKVAFGAGGPTSTIRSYGYGKSEGPFKGSVYGGKEEKLEKEYKEPWNYYTYYPATLPLRRPYSGNPELLNKEEFEENPEGLNYNEHAINSAAELGLMEDNLRSDMIFLQLPEKLPMVKQDTKIEVKGTDKNAKPPKVTGKKQEATKFDELPAGLMGKLLVYKSGAVKLKLGDALYDVSAGLAGIFAKDVVVVNTEEKHCCNLGELKNRSVVTPDIDSILDNMADL